jgi:hypothetical protein
MTKPAITPKDHADCRDVGHAKPSGQSVVAATLGRFAPLCTLAFERSASWTKLREVSMLGGGRMSDEVRAKAARRCERLPDLATLSDQAEAFYAAVYTRAKPDEVRWFVGVLFDGNQAWASRATRGAIDAIAFSLEHADDDRDPDAPHKFRGFSAAALAMAVQRIWLDKKFDPNICEIVQAAKDARARFWMAWRATERLIEIRDDADDVLAVTDPDAPPIDPDEMPF